MAGARLAGRPNQKQRTRKDLLQAAARLMKQGKSPSLDDVAEEALVSRATAYRYFSSIEALLRESALDMAVPGADLFAEDQSRDAVARLERADAALNEMIAANEQSLRLMLAHALTTPITDKDTPRRQNRRSALIEAALAPAAKEFRPAQLKMLRQALALVIGTEAMVVCKDVLQIDNSEAQKVRRWAIRALVNAAGS